MRVFSLNQGYPGGYNRMHVEFLEYYSFLFVHFFMTIIINMIDFTGIEYFKKIVNDTVLMWHEIKHQNIKIPIPVENATYGVLKADI